MRESEFSGVAGVSHGEKNDDDLRWSVGPEIVFLFKERSR